jgi:1,4-alpha-glucan branching enzyme
VPGRIGRGAVYKYPHSFSGAYRVNKVDPLAFTAEVAPKTGSVVWDLDYEWVEVDADAPSAEHRKGALVDL